MLPHKSCEAFLSVAECGSFEVAASKLHITASAVTLRVQALEKQLGHILILRERPCRVTATGQTLLGYLQHQRLMENNLLQQLQGQNSANPFYQLNIATNADSSATWLLTTLRPILIQEKITIHLIVDDQSQTHQLLENGLVNACISAESETIKGCIAHHLGAMTYKLVCTPNFKQQWFAQGILRETIRQAPAVIFNNKDQLHEDMTRKLFGLNMQDYPYHFVPCSTAFVETIELGLGFGMVPEMQIHQQLKSGQLIELIPQAQTHVDLYWHYWKQQSLPLQSLTTQIIEHTQQLIKI